jgi:hypothetical protein
VYAGFLEFKGVGSGTFNDLHVTVTTNAATCGKGFHISAYKSQLVGTHAPENAVARIYYTVNESTGAATQVDENGDYNSILNSWFFSSWLREACEFYMELFNIRIVKKLVIEEASFPSLVAPTKPVSIPTVTPPTIQPMATAPLPNPLVTPSSVPVGNPAFFAMVEKSLDYSKGYSLF